MSNISINKETEGTDAGDESYKQDVRVYMMGLLKGGELSPELKILEVKLLDNPKFTRELLESFKRKLEIPSVSG